jgi:hypothetical protein
VRRQAPAGNNDPGDRPTLVVVVVIIIVLIVVIVVIIVIAVTIAIIVVVIIFIVVIVVVIVVVPWWQICRRRGNGGSQPIQIQQRWQHGCWGGIAIAAIVIRKDNAPIIDIIVIDPQTRIIKIAASADGRSRRLRDSPSLCDDRAVNDVPAEYGI